MTIPTNRLPARLSGQLLIELLLAMAIFALILPAIIAGLITSNQSDTLNQRRLEATAIAHEINEAMRVIRQEAWANIATPGIYHVETDGTTWSLEPNEQTLDDFTRRVEISNVNRDPVSGEIVSSGGNLDPSTKKIVTTVSWVSPMVNSVSQEYYLTRYLDNIIVPDSTVAEFNQGILAGTAVTNQDGGEVTLGAGGQGDWCDPNLNITAIDLPKSGVANAISAIPGQVVAGTGENASGVSFAKISVQDVDPPTGSIDGTFDGYKTNAVFTESRYAYLATDTNSKEVIIIDMQQTNPSTGKYLEVGYFDAPGNSNGVSVATSGNIGFVTTGTSVYSFNLTSKSGSRAQLASRSLPAEGTKIAVAGSDLYISIAGAAKELQVVRFNGTGTSLTNYGYADVNGAAAYDVAVNATGTRAYLATGYSSSQPEFFIINTSGKSSSNPNLSNVGTYNAGSMSPLGVAVVPGNKAILVGTGGEEYQVINIANESNPLRCGGLQIDSGVFDIGAVLEADNDAYSYIVTGDNLLELKIIEGGPGGQYANQGTFISRIIDVGYSSVFNYFDWVVQVVANTTLEYQIALADPVSGSCATANYTYIGPDKSSSTYFNGPATIPFDDDGIGYENPAQCFRYKLFFTTTDPFSSPEMLEMTVNYNP